LDKKFELKRLGKVKEQANREIGVPSVDERSVLPVTPGVVFVNNLRCGFLKRQEINPDVLVFSTLNAGKRYWVSSFNAAI
jgi:hypothetical protein